MDSNVLKAILAMDAYNRGHNAGIQLQGSNLGSVTILSDSLVLGDTTDENGNVVRLDEYYGFYGIAYQLDGGETIVSYRGTDQAPDLFAALQSGDWSKFLTADVMNGNILTTETNIF